MKIRSRRKSVSARQPAAPDVADLINRMHLQLVSIERKMDSLIGQSPARTAEGRHFPSLFQRSDKPQPYGGVKQDNMHRERVLHKAVCADCKKGCEVPFKPSGDRPVYCKECFAKRKNPGLFRERHDNRPREEVSVQPRHADKHQAVDHRKPVEKKKPGLRRRKTRA